MNRNLLMVLGGCAVLLFVCCIGVAVLWFVVDLPSQITNVFGETISQLEPTVAPIPPGVLKTTPVVPGTVPTAAPPPVGTKPPAPASSASGNPLQSAMDKIKSASKYRLEFTWVFGSTQNGKYQEQPFFNMAGQVDGQNMQLTSKGGLLAFLTTDPNTNIEIIDAGGKTYMRGINMFGMADPKTWYIMDSSSTSGFKDFANPDQIDGFSGGKSSPFKKSRSESVDGLACDVYTYDFKNLQNAAVIGMLGSAQDKNEFSAIDKAETSVWLCADGYVHKYTVNYEGHDAKNPAEKGALKITVRTWDFNNAAIRVTAPADAKPFPGTR